MKELSRQNADDIITVIDYLIAIEKNGKINKNDLPVLYGDGTRWKTLTLKGFIACYESYVEAKEVQHQNVDD